MTLYRTFPFVRHILEKQLHPQAYAIDATVGNGNDTLSIARLLSHSGKLFGFDIQDEAIQKTHLKLQTERLCCSTQLFHASHSQMLDYLASYLEKIDCVIFNLGYLPHVEQKNITTTINTTYTAILQAIALLKRKGLLIVVAYPGHREGLIETEQLTRLFAQAQPDTYYITTYKQINQDKQPPQIFLLEKRKSFL